MNTLDIIVVAVVALSGLFAFVRGFVREALSIAAWVGAAAVTVYCYQPFQPVVRGLIRAVWLADIVTAVALFVVSLVAFSIVVGVLSSRVRQSSLGPLDRALGLVFGVARGVVIVCLGYLVMSHFLAPESRPNWIVQARSLKLLALGASQLQQLIPHSTIERGAAAATGAAQELDAAAKAGGAVVHAGEAMRSAADAMRDLEQPKPKPKPPAADGSGYRTEQQQEMNRAIQAIQGAE